MTKKDKFLLWTYLGSIARDINTPKRDAQSIVTLASRIPERNIPPNEFNAAQVYIAYVTGKTRFHRWMVPQAKREKMADGEKAHA